MQVTVGELQDAMTTLTQIINRPRNIPQLAKFRIAKLHSHLVPFYKNNVQNPMNALIQHYGEEIFEKDGVTPKGWGVPEQTPKHKEYMEAWAKEREKTVDIGRVSPITWQSFGDASVGGIEANEIIFLGPFLTTPPDEVQESVEERESNP